jgi:hypothetical protein
MTFAEFIAVLLAWAASMQPITATELIAEIEQAAPREVRWVLVSYNPDETFHDANCLGRDYAATVFYTSQPWTQYACSALSVEDALTLLLDEVE